MAVLNHDPLIKLSNLQKHYQVGAWRRKMVKAVHNVSLSIYRGETMGLVGESGCGKSTVARLLTRLTPATSGSATLAGNDILGRKTKLELLTLRRSLQLVFQDPIAALDPRMKVGDSLHAPLVHHGIRDVVDRQALIRDMLANVGLDRSFVEKYPGECSGGQLQRVVIARALLLSPSFLICDEPTSALDASMRTQVLNLLSSIKRKYSLTLLMISHDLRMVKFMCDHIAVMYLGQIVEINSAKALVENPKHPYTRALLSASGLDGTISSVSSTLAMGDPPSPINPPSGCHFHTRCAHASDVCKQEMPDLEILEDGAEIRCHHWRQLQSGGF